MCTRVFVVGAWAAGAVLAFQAGCERQLSRSSPNRRGDFPVVVIETSAGTIQAELWPDKAPVTVENFLRYVDEGHYTNTVFHRVIIGFMIQGGGLTPELQPKSTHAPIRNEADNGLRNLTGTLTMARTDKVHSATDQFFINTADNRILDHGIRDFGYAVFGQVVEGMDAVRAIERAPSADPQKGIPVRPVVIYSIRRAEGSP